MYSNDVAPDRRTFRTVFRDSFSSRTISLIVLPFTKCSRLIRPIVSTTSILRHPLGIKAGQPACHRKKGGQSWTPITPLRRQSSTPDHSGESELGGFSEKLLIISFQNIFRGVNCRTPCGCHVKSFFWSFRQKRTVLLPLGRKTWSPQRPGRSQQIKGAAV